MDYGFFLFPILSHLRLLTLVFAILFLVLVAYKYLGSDMSNCRFTILVSQDVSLHYFQTNTTLCRIGA